MSENRRSNGHMTFLHYPLADTADGFVPILNDPTPDDLDTIFARYQAHVVFYGHTHRASDMVGQSRYVNLGALGCHKKPVARFAVLECARGEYRLKKCAVPYDDMPLFAEFEKRRVPEREFIYQAFFGKKWSK